MSSGGEKVRSLIQCTTCGRVHDSRSEYPIEELYVEDYCPDCGSYIGLNLGDNKENLYELYDANLDERFFIYK